jgi:hypothetical protein
MEIRPQLGRYVQRVFYRECNGGEKEMARTGTSKAAAAGTSNTTASDSAGATLTKANAPVPQARSVAIAADGIRTGQDFASLMTALMSDIIEERISPNVANAAINAGGKLLKVVEMQYKYNRPRPVNTDTPAPAFELGGVS